MPVAGGGGGVRGVEEVERENSFSRCKTKADSSPSLWRTRDRKREPCSSTRPRGLAEGPTSPWHVAMTLLHSFTTTKAPPKTHGRRHSEPRRRRRRRRRRAPLHLLLSVRRRLLPRRRPNSALPKRLQQFLSFFSSLLLVLRPSSVAGTARVGSLAAPPRFSVVFVVFLLAPPFPQLGASGAGRLSQGPGQLLLQLRAP